MSSFSLFPESASTISGQVDALFFFMVGTSLFFGLLVAILVIYMAIRYRRRAGDTGAGAEIHGNLQLEIAWSIVPFVIAMVMFYWGASVYMTMARPPDDAHEIFVVGKQWMWKLQHLEGRREINELHVPVNQPIKLTMTSEDVIHSFYVPAFRIKADAVPGRYSTAWFEATKVGTYHLFCAEYCGTEHSQMIGRIVVMEPNEFQDWLSGETTVADAGSAMVDATRSPAEIGAELFVARGCTTCHQGAAGVMGPSLAGLYGRERNFADGRSAVADEAYLRQSILEPQSQILDGYQPIMPTFKGQIDEEGLLALIQYIKTLEPNEG